MASMKVGIVGCGNIATDLCLALQKGDIPAEVVALTDIDASKAAKLNSAFGLKAKECALDETAASVDFVVECAVAEVVKDVVEAALKYRRDLLVVSVGGLILYPDLMDRARAGNIRLLIPSGALCGLDGVRAASEAGIDRATLTTRKPPKGLAGAPYLKKHGIEVEGLTEPKVVFEGTAREAVKAFPRNVNVAATLSIAGLGPDKTMVRVIADPNATANSHEVVVEGAFGRLRTVAENLPSPRNPKSSYLASLSACAELRAAATTFVAHSKG